MSASADPGSAKQHNSSDRANSDLKLGWPELEEFAPGANLGDQAQHHMDICVRAEEHTRYASSKKRPPVDYIRTLVILVRTYVKGQITASNKLLGDLERLERSIQNAQDSVEALGSASGRES